MRKGPPPLTRMCLRVNFFINRGLCQGGYRKVLGGMWVGIYLKKSVDILASCAILFSVMRDRMKNQHIDWLNAQDDRVIAPVEGHEGYRVVTAMRASDLACDVAHAQDDFASPVDEDCGWFGYEGLCED